MVQFHLMLVFLLPSKTSAEVVKALDRLERTIGTEAFKKAFPVILTDRGSEFDDLEDWMVLEMQNRIANYVRRELGGRAPIEVLSAVMGEDTLKALGMKKVDPAKINLSMSDFVKPEQSKG